MKYRDPITNTFKDLTVKVSDTLPIGTIVGYAGATAPDGWLICDGSAISRSLYSALFSVIGTTYGAGNGSTTFNIPDYRNRVPVGLDTNDSDFNVLGKTGGEKEHTLIIEEMPSHRHNLQIEFGTTTNLNSDVHGGHYHQTTERTSYPVNDRILDTGGGQPHNILQPYIVENYIIKAYQPIAVPGKVVDAYSVSTKDAYSARYVNWGLDEVYESAVIYTQDSAIGRFLWTNPNPTEVMSENVTITLSSSDYDILEVIYDDNVMDSDHSTYSVKYLKGYHWTSSYIKNNEKAYRQISRTNDTTFVTGTAYLEGNIQNRRCVPLYVIGYKTGLFD